MENNLREAIKIVLGILGILILGGIIYAATRPAAEPNSSSGIPIQSHRSYTIQSNAEDKTYTADTPTAYSFAIVDERGDTLKAFAITHTKPMHVIVVRKDLKYFQHLHPEYNENTGTFILSNLTFPADGEYRIFADFAAEGGWKDPNGNPLGITLSEDVRVGTTYIPEPLGPEEKTKTFNGLQVTFGTHGTLTSGAENMLMFTFSQNGRPVTDLQEYLGALGHVIVLQEGTLDFIHAHPMGDRVAGQNGNVSFMAGFPETGKYKVFAQFQRGGKVLLTEFVISVAEGTGGEAGSGGMMH